MDCREAQNRLEELPEALQRQELPSDIHEHLEHCASCSAAWRELVESWGLLDVLEPIEPTPSLRKGLFRKIKVLERQEKPLLRKWILRLSPALAAAAVFLAALLFQSYSSSLNPSEEQEVVQHLDLLQDMDLIEHLDMVAQFDEIEGLTEEDLTL